MILNLNLLSFDSLNFQKIISLNLLSNGPIDSQLMFIPLIISIKDSHLHILINPNYSIIYLCFLLIFIIKKLIISYMSPNLY